ncbi:MAG: bifunctional UDP-N-acetylmuramoyl-tripeptide:D-alanyl-D-alanine ligase/alanine racemase [Saprospiraceae bacterium]|nr:bifunctional UDP-N-acetylmuramoyl-tripeptide:D-alanyl-D-alanine ligase/alanine racemase [Saprospiraceae bacterium]
MTCYSAAHIARLLGSEDRFLSDPDTEVCFLSMDTRRLEDPARTLFFALKGSLHNGHEFVAEAIARGVRHCVVEFIPEGMPEEINWFPVGDTLAALQVLAGAHRRAFPQLDILAITGSNGKTTIKEWLDLLITDRRVVKSPRSYNSQTGVALSLWQVDARDELGIFEAGISQPGEMVRLEEMIHPGIGLFTMLGDAHTEGFDNPEHKLAEKLQLFRHCHTIIFEEDQSIVSEAIRLAFPEARLCSWGTSMQSTLFRILSLHQKLSSTSVDIQLGDGSHLSLQLPFVDPASVQNCLHCIAVLLVLRIPVEKLASDIRKLHNLPMRLEMKKGIQASILINDTYNADLQSCRIALDFLNQQAGNRIKVLIVSDFFQTGLSTHQFCVSLADLIRQHGIHEVYCIGSQLTELSVLVENISLRFFTTTDAFLEELPKVDMQMKAVLVKGARMFQLERVIAVLSEKAHTAVLETNLQAVDHNLGIFTETLSPGTQTIGVIKASAYGSGSVELARLLEFRKVGYLAVAFIDEGIELRKAGIRLPVMILNPDRNGMQEMVRWQLEPEVYCLEQLDEMLAYVHLHNVSDFRIHVKLDTGMHRLGFLEADLPVLTERLGAHPAVCVASVFSHLTSSEDAADDSFTHRQAEKFLVGYEFISQSLGYRPPRHLLNSAGIVRFPGYHFEMVRLGLGLYGFDSSGAWAGKLEKVHCLKATVVQVKDVGPGAHVGYNRRGIASEGGRIAVVNLGYADGLMRIAGNAKYSLRIRGRDFPILGNVCMDLTMVDLGFSEDVAVGDEVVVFSHDKPLETLAEVCMTIPYEILSRISARVRRIYVQG